MKSLWSIPLSSRQIWEFSLVLILFYLVLHPPMAYPQAMAVALGGGLLLLLFKPIKPESLFTLGRAWWLFLFYLLLSGFWSLVPGVTFQSAGLVFVGALLYLMTRSVGEENRKRLETWVWILACMAALWALYQMAFGFDEMKFDLPGLPKMNFRIVEKAIYYQRTWGPLTTSGSLAALMILLIPYGAIQAKTNAGFKRVLFSLLTLILLAALWTTKSVGAWGCLTIAVLGVFLLGEGRKWAWLALVIGIGGVIGIVWARGFQHWSVSSFNMRFLLWQSAWELFLKHPFLGTGLGTFDEAYQQSGYSLVQGGARYPHNLLLQLLTETGLLGTGFFIAGLFGLVRRLRVPFRWEGWGVMTGVLAFFLFSFLDLPFQMPELIWIFSVFAARLEIRPEKALRLPALPIPWLEWGLLAVLLVSGFWPPFQPWNFAILAGALWVAMALMGKTLGEVPLWIFIGASYILFRAFVSPSAIGTVLFLEAAGMGLVFWLVLSGSPGDFFRLRLCLLGLAWGAGAWIVSFSGAPYEAWANYTNPKHLAVYLIPLFLLFFPVKSTKMRKGFVSLLAIATIIRLRASGAVMGLGAGILFLPKLSKPKKILFVAGLLISGAIVHHFQPSSTQWDRLLIWKASLQVWWHHPFWGNGPGVFAGEFHRVKEPRTGGLSRYLMSAGYSHNEPLEFLTAFGLAGGFFLFFFIIYVWRRLEGVGKPAWAAMGMASLVDFCFHTPRTALMVIAFGPRNPGSKSLFSWPGGFLAMGLCLGLFGSAAFVPALRRQAMEQETKKDLPQELRYLEAAENLNAWDVQTAWAKAQLLEKLYLTTGDSNWKDPSNEGLDRVLYLEPNQGDWYLQKAEILSRRFLKEGTNEALAAATCSWRQAENQLPFSAFLRYEEGMFFLRAGQKEEASSSLKIAVGLEPNYAVAWAKLGFLLKMEGKPGESKEAFRAALRVYGTWKDKPVDPQEQPMLAIPDGVLSQMSQEVRL